MALIEKVEYHVIGADQEPYAYEDSLDDAMDQVDASTVRIDKVTTYIADYTTVWVKEQEEE